MDDKATDLKVLYDIRMQLPLIREARYCPSIAYCGNCPDTEIAKRLAFTLESEPASRELLYKELVRSEGEYRSKILKCFALAGGGLDEYTDPVLEIAWAQHDATDEPSLAIISGIGRDRIETIDRVLSYLSPAEPEWIYPLKRRGGGRLEHQEVLERYPQYLDETGQPNHELMETDRDCPFWYATDRVQLRRGDAIDGSCIFQAFPDRVVPALAAAWDVFEEYDSDFCYNGDPHERICDSLVCFGERAVLALPALCMELERCLDPDCTVESSYVGPCKVLAAIGPAAVEVLPLLIEIAQQDDEDPNAGAEYYRFANVDPLVRAICALRGLDPNDYTD